MTVCLDSWAVLEWLQRKEPAFSRVENELDGRPLISWINLVEVYYRIERNYGRELADQTVGDLRAKLKADLPTQGRMIEAARINAVNSIALGDCFALATASAHGVTLWTGDPEILNLQDPPCPLEDLRRSPAAGQLPSSEP